MFDSKSYLIFTCLTDMSLRHGDGNSCEMVNLKFTRVTLKKIINALINLNKHVLFKSNS